MGQSKPTNEAKETRIHHCREVSLGLAKKVAQDEARRCPQCAQPTCLVGGCPLGIDIPGFIRFLREGDAVAALERINKNNPFPAICGRICPAPCENACIFHHEGAAISIRALERYAADFGQSKQSKKPVVVLNGKKIAIIGAGPSGLSAAYYLASEGYAVSIFESMDQPGGLLRYGIPEFRLPQKVLDDQIEHVKNLGVEIQTNVFVGRTLTVQEIFMQGFAVILVAVGAGVVDFAAIEGANLGGVFYAEEFLARLQALGKDNVYASAASLFKGTSTVVVGGSSSAIDAARMALRLGQKVHLVFPGIEEQIDAYGDDVKAAIEEGVMIEAPVEPLAIEAGDNEFTKGLRCRRLEMIEGAKSLVLEPIKESDFVIEAETIILAHGRRPNAFLKTHLPQLKFNDNGAMWIDENSGQTSVDKIFACGNVVTGAGAVVDAIASGKVAAGKIGEYLKRI